MTTHDPVPADGMHESRWVAVGHRIGWVVGCWIGVLLLTGLVQVVRMQWFDAAVFLVAALAVAFGPVVPHTHHTPAPLPWAVLATLAVVVGAVMLLVPSHGTAMKALVITVGAGTAVLAWDGRAVRAPEAPTAWTPGIRCLAIAWTAIVVAGCAWELAQFSLGLAQPQGAWYSLSELADPFVLTPLGKALFTIAWLASGVWLLRRGGRR